MASLIFQFQTLFNMYCSGWLNAVDISILIRNDTGFEGCSISLTVASISLSLSSW